MDETSILNVSKNHMLQLDQQNIYSGISTNVYQFSYNSANYWHPGHTFSGNYVEDLSFEGMVKASDDSNKREATFLVHEADQQDAVEDMMERALRLKHDGIMRPSVVGYNKQISKFISAFSVSQPTLTLDGWLAAENQKPSLTSIPSEVRQLLWTAYQAIATMWKGEYTSDSLADPCSYHMINGKIKIDPLCIRRKRREETDGMLIRSAFGIMIWKHIYPVWKDDELKDFVELVNNPNASELDILEAPVLLLPASRELLYHTFANAAPEDAAREWLEQHANPADGWKLNARSADPILQTIMEYQERHGADFSTNYKGAMHFGSVVTSHYPLHFRQSAEGRSGVKLEGRIDSVLKQVLPRQLTKRYNSKFQPFQAPQL